MISKYRLPALTSLLGRLSFRVVVFALVMVPMTSSPALNIVSLAQEPPVRNQDQQSTSSEWTGPANPQGDPEVSRQTIDVSRGDIKSLDPTSSLFAATLFGIAQPGNNEFTITGLPSTTRVVSVWMTESANGHSHIGSAVFSNSSVQLSSDGTRVRIRYNLAYTRALPALAMIIGFP